MKKRLAVLITVVFLLAGILYEYMHLRKEETPANVAITAIPIDASFIFESRKNFSLWKGISQTNLIWQDLLGTDPIKELDHNVKYLDSLLQQDPKVKAVVENQPVFVSAHKNGLEHFDYLFTCSMPNANSEEALHQFMENSTKNGSMTQSQYDGIIEYCLKIPGKDDFYYAVNKGIFIGSFKSELVQESLRQMESGISLLDNSHFKKVVSFSSGQPIAQLFINYQNFYNVAAPVMNKGVHGYLSSLQDFAQWTGLDVFMTPDELIMNGFTEADSTGGQFISLFNNQQSQPAKVTSIVPANTSFINCMEISDAKTFIKNYREYMGLHRRTARHNEWVDKIEKTFNINVERNFYSWLDNEISLVITEPSDSTLQNDTYTIIGTNNVNTAIKDLSMLADSVRGDEEKHFEPYQYMNHDIGYIALDNMIPNLLGGAFEAMKQTYYTTINNYVVFANNNRALELFINKYEGGSTLAKDEYYQLFTREHIENESGIYIYNNVSLSPLLYEQYLDASYSEDLKKHTDITRKMQAIGIQFNYMQGMFYTNVYFKRNPQYKKQAGALWQASLDTAMAVSPIWVPDFKTKSQCILTQDKGNTAYLIDNSGHTVWHKDVEEPIMGRAYAVDALKNEKSQFLFNTEKDIYVIDHNGKNLYGFPVTIPSKANAPIALFDYDNKRSYRIAVPCDDYKIRMYDINGKGVKDWKAPETEADVKCPLQYVNVEDEDYLIAVDDKGNVYAFDRKGKSKVGFKNKLPEHIRHFNIMRGKQASETYIFAADSMGTVYELSLTDFLTTTKYIKGNSPISDFAPIDFNGDGKTELVFITKYDVYAYGLDKKELFHFSVNDSLKKNLLIFTAADGKGHIGAVDAEKKKLYMWDSQGNICNGFPLYGSTIYSIADMNNDGQLYLVTGASDNSVYVYSLP